MVQYDWASSPKVIKAEVNTLLTEFQTLLGEQLVGVYLHGSLASGGFNPERGDIDLIAVTTQKIVLEMKRKIVELLLRISKAPCPVEISFLVQQDIMPYHHPLPFDLHYSERWRERLQQDVRDGNWQRWDATMRYDSDLAAHLTVLHHDGICLYGKPIAGAIPDVPEQDFRAAIVEDFQLALGKRARDPIYFVLNACRVYAYLRDGELLSKDEGGVWGLSNLPAQFHVLLNQSLALYRGDKLGRPAGRAALDNFAAMMDEAIRSYP